MKRIVLNGFSLLLCVLCSVFAYAQTTVTTGLVGGTSAAATGVNVFAVTNSNTYSIAITTFSVYHNTGTNNNRNYTVWYHPTALTGAPNITAANGWIQLATSPNISITTSQITPVLTNQYLVIPPNTTYRIAIVCNSGLAYFATTGNNTYSAGSVTIQTGSSTVSPGYAGSMPAPSLTPRYFAGSVTFIPASVRNVAALTLLSPTASTAYCAYDSTPVRVVIRNTSDSSQSNFPVTARVTGTTTNTYTATYTNTLAPFTNDTFTVTKLNLSQGSYSVRAYTQLATDTIRINDTTPSVSFSFKRPVTLPVTVSDSICSGGNSTLVVNGVANTTYRWFSAQSGGSLLNIGTSVIFTNVTQDTVMWIAADSANCLSTRVPIGVFIKLPPNPDLGTDTAFCESVPLVLDAQNPGAQYLWSTGDTTQTIQVTNVSGAYWVQVTKFCMRADTVNVTIKPVPYVFGISYVRSTNTYFFQASSHLNVESFEWYFGDGPTPSNDSTPIHTYASNITTALTVMLVVKNSCGTDTVYKTIPTAVNDLDNETGVHIYPNPVSEKLFVTAENAKIEDLSMYNLTGSLVFRETNFAAGKSVDISSLPAGNYIVRLRTDKGLVSKPVQIKR